MNISLEGIVVTILIVMTGVVVHRLCSKVEKACDEFASSLRDVRAKGREACEETKKFFGDPKNRQEMKKSVEDVLAHAIERGLTEAVRKLTEKKEK